MQRIVHVSISNIRLCPCAHLEINHVFSHPLKQGQKTPFCIEPGVRFQLLALRLHRLDDPGYAKFIIPFHTVQCSYHQVDNAEMEAVFGWVLQTTKAAKNASISQKCYNTDCMPQQSRLPAGTLTDPTLPLCMLVLRADVSLQFFLLPYPFCILLAHVHHTLYCQVPWLHEGKQKPQADAAANPTIQA